MALQPFDLACLSTIDDGRVGVAFEHALRRCEADCRDRPSLAKARSVTLECSLVPRTDETGKDLLEVVLSVKVTDSVPSRSTRPYHMVAARSGLYFNELAPDDARQLTIPVGPTPTTTPQPERKDLHVG